MTQSCPSRRPTGRSQTGNRTNSAPRSQGGRRQRPPPPTASDVAVSVPLICRLSLGFGQQATKAQSLRCFRYRVG
jgi:hypothetical protein